MFRHCNFEEAYEDLMHEARKAQRERELEMDGRAQRTGSSWRVNDTGLQSSFPAGGRNSGEGITPCRAANRQR